MRSSLNPRSTLKVSLILLAAFAAFNVSKAFCKTTEGPVISVESGTDAKIKDNKGNVNATETSRTRTEIEIFFPIKIEKINSEFFPIFYHYRELRGDDRDPTSTGTDLPKDRSVMALGGANIYKTANFNVLTAAINYRSLRKSDPKSHMLEGVMGLSLTKLPSFFACEQSASVLLRYREFPHGGRFLPLVYYKLESPGGYFVDIRLPSRVVGGREFLDHKYALFGGVKWESGDYPVYVESTPAWTEGYVTNFFIGGRRRLFSFYFLDLRAGLWSETAKIYTEDERVVDYQTGYSPWIRLAVQTVLFE